MARVKHSAWLQDSEKELLLGLFGGTATTLKTVEKEHFFMFFDFDKKEVGYGNQRV